MGNSRQDAVKADLRARLVRRKEMRRFFDEYPHLDAETRRAILGAPAEVNRSSDPYGQEMRPYNPSDYHWSAADAYAACPDLCRECYTARPYPAGQRHFGWALWRDCRPDECGHAHHADEVWIG